MSTTTGIGAAPPAADVRAAYATCAEITRVQARNFHYGIRLLPPDKRAALCAVYALARGIDDIGDDLPDLADGAASAAAAADADARLRRLADLRAALADLDRSRDPVLVAVRDAASRFPIPLAAFGELLDGVETDIVGRRFATFGELEHYCRCVAGSIGRLCLGVFGAGGDPAVAAARADALGIALQQTNILRDLREDLLNGRVYLPQDDLDRFGVQLRVGADGRLVDDAGALSALVRWSAERARSWYADGLTLVPLLDRRSAACCTAMAGIYRRLLDRISDDPSCVFAGRTSLTGWQKGRVAARALARRSA